MKKKIVTLIYTTLVFFLAIAQGCSSGGGSSSNPSGQTTTPNPVATAVGSPVGSAATATIGPSGGTVTSLDSKLTVSIPAGALAADTVIGIEPITNNAHGGVGSAYRLTPDGQIFSQPVQLTFSYTDQDITGSAPSALSVAFQTTDGYWQLVDMVTVDAAAKTITASVSHFTDFSWVERLRIDPFTSDLYVDNAVLLHVQISFPIEGPPPATGGAGPILGTGWYDFSGPSFPAQFLRNWSVNGIVGGDTTVGTLYPDIDRCGYTAPHTRPTPNTVAVSVEAAFSAIWPATADGVLVAYINIIDPGSYAGSLQFSLDSGVSGTADIEWIPVQDLGDTKTYQPVGSITADFNLLDCDHKQQTVSVDSTSNSLVVYTSLNSAFPKQYQFTLFGDPNTMVTLQCGTPRTDVQYPASSLIPLIIGNCPGAAMPSFTDMNVLSGSWDCTLSGLLSSSWTFTAQ
jgi:hypothetical protein